MNLFIILHLVNSFSFGHLYNLTLNHLLKLNTTFRKPRTLHTRVSLLVLSLFVCHVALIHTFTSQTQLGQSRILLTSFMVQIFAWWRNVYIEWIRRVLLDVRERLQTIRQKIFLLSTVLRLICVGASLNNVFFKPSVSLV